MGLHWAQLRCRGEVDAPWWGSLPAGFMMVDAVGEEGMPWWRRKLGHCEEAGASTLAGRHVG